MFHAKFAYALDFKAVVNAIKNVVGTAHWRITPDSMDLQALTSGRVVMTVVRLNHSSLAFEVYDFPENEGVKEIVLPLWTEGLYNLLQASKHDDTLSLRASLRNPSHVELTFQGRDTGTLNSIREALMGWDMELYNIPESQIVAEVRMSSHKFAEMCNAFSKGGMEDIVFSLPANGKTFTMSRKTRSEEEIVVSIDNGSEFSGRTKKNMVKTRITNDRDISKNISFIWLREIMTAKTLSDSVTLSFDVSTSDLIFCVQYVLPNGLGAVKFFIAPTPK